MSSTASATAANGILRWYERTLRALAGGSMALVVIVMLVQVAARYVFNASLIWAEELCRYVLIWQTFLFVSVAFQRGELVAVEFLAMLLPARMVLVLRTLVTLPVIAFLVLMVQNGYVYAARFDKQTIPAIDFIWMSITGRAAGLTVVWIYISVSVGLLLLLLHMLASLFVDWRGFHDGSGAEPPVTDLHAGAA